MHFPVRARARATRRESLAWSRQIDFMRRSGRRGYFHFWFIINIHISRKNAKRERYVRENGKERYALAIDVARAAIKPSVIFIFAEIPDAVIALYSRDTSGTVVYTSTAFNI